MKNIDWNARFAAKDAAKNTRNAEDAARKLTTPPVLVRYVTERSEPKWVAEIHVIDEDGNSALVDLPRIESVGKRAAEQVAEMYGVSVEYA